MCRRQGHNLDIRTSRGLNLPKTCCNANSRMWVQDILCLCNRRSSIAVPNRGRGFHVTHSVGGEDIPCSIQDLVIDLERAGCFQLLEPMTDLCAGCSCGDLCPHVWILIKLMLETKMPQQSFKIRGDEDVHCRA